jgi:predicted dehydrogenase
MTRPINVGIVGLGKMGDIRASVLQRRSDVTLVAGADPDQARHAQYPGVDCHADYRRVVGSPDVDAVFVCTPNRYTADVVVAALEAGKHVFCEKPPGRDRADVERIIEAERRAGGLVLKFGFNHRYHAGIQEARRILDGGRLGSIIWARGIYGKGGGLGFENGWRSARDKSGGGILLDQGIHMLDLLRLFLGEFVEIKSMVTTAFWKADVEDNAFALLRDAQGRIAFLHSSSTQWKHRFLLELYTTDGFLSVNGILSSTRSYGDETITIAHRRFDDTVAIGKPREETVYFDTDPSWALEVGEFIDAVQGKRPLEHGTSADAVAAMDLVYRIYEADPNWAKTSNTIPNEGPRATSMVRLASGRTERVRRAGGKDG